MLLKLKIRHRAALDFTAIPHVQPSMDGNMFLLTMQGIVSIDYPKMDEEVRMMFRNILVAGIQVVAQIATAIVLVYWVINPENIDKMLQINYVVAYGLFLLLWVLIDILDILYIRGEKEDHKKNEN